MYTAYELSRFTITGGRAGWSWDGDLLCPLPFIPATFCYPVHCGVPSPAEGHLPLPSQITGPLCLVHHGGLGVVCGLNPHTSVFQMEPQVGPCCLPSTSKLRPRRRKCVAPEGPSVLSSLHRGPDLALAFGSCVYVGGLLPAKTKARTLGASSLVLRCWSLTQGTTSLPGKMASVCVCVYV